jgi:hypothetical protein
LVLAVQASQAAVAGVIRDGESGEPLAGAAVTLTDVDRATASDSLGRYRLIAVPAGPQHLSVKRIGYSPRTIHALVPGQGELEIDLSLHPVPLQLPTIMVRSTVPVRGLEPGDSTAFPDRGISASGLRNHPLLAEPDGFLALSGGEIAMGAEAPSGVHIRGGASDQTAYLLDGVPVFSPYHAAGTFSAWNPDALDRLQVLAGSPSLAPPDALSGTVAAATRSPGRELRAQGTVSTSHGRVTLHGPLGASGAGFLLSARSGLPGLVPPEGDPSYLRGRTGDVLAKVEIPVFGGRLRVLGYDSGNEIDAATLAESPDSASAAPPRNEFEWDSRSFGVEWARSAGDGVALRIQGWNARGEAEAIWRPTEGAGFRLESDREDQGILAAVERGSAERFSGAGIRVQRSWTSYRAVAREDSGVGTSLETRTPLASVFVQHRRPVTSGLTADVALAATGAMGDIHLGLQSELRWRPSAVGSISASYARMHQFSQSLRNSESVVGAVFPADLYVGAGAPGIPVARNDRAVVGAELLARAGFRLGTQAYLSDFDGVLLVAPRSGTPFAAGGFLTGAGTSRGLSLEAAVSGARYGVTASYGWQRVRVTYGDSSYAPGYGTSHLIETGVIVFPVPTASLRLGLTGAVGRRGTGILGAFEWESCNLLDQGCEFGGSPTHQTDRPGATRLPAYFRLDLGLRKHWHLEVAGRDIELALFGTVTNLLGRRNVLAVATDPITGEKTEIEMRPLAPLVVGMDWRF